VDWNKHDRYGRIVGKVIFDGQDVDLAMVQEGYAWWYRKYASEQNAGGRVLYEAAGESQGGAPGAMGRSAPGAALGMVQEEASRPMKKAFHSLP
jgi:hypothetical protein